MIDIARRTRWHGAALALCLFLAGGQAWATGEHDDDDGGGSPPVSSSSYQYAAKFVCGEETGSNDRVIEGIYATTVGIHNPTGGTVQFTKKITLTYPPAAQAPGEVSAAITDTLGGDESLQVDCQEIPAEFIGAGGGFVQGFLVVKSDTSLDVSAVYTSGSTSEGEMDFLSIAKGSVPTCPPECPPTEMSVTVTSIDVEQIKERVVTTTSTGGGGKDDCYGSHGGSSGDDDDDGCPSGGYSGGGSGDDDDDGKTTFGFRR